MPITEYESLNADSKFKHSTWRQKDVRWTSDVRHGYLYPVQVLEVLPSDVWKIVPTIYTRMNKPIAPIFGNIYQHIVSFFVPKRILFDKCKQFYGEAESFGVATTIAEPTISSDDYIVPRSYLDGPDKWCTFGSAFGLVSNLAAVPSAANRIPMNVLPIYGFAAIYNEYFRNENYQKKYMYDKTAYGNSTTRAYLTYGLTNITAKSELPRVNKDSDIFSTILPYALKNSAGEISLPLGTSAPLLGSIAIQDDSNFKLNKVSDGTFAGQMKYYTNDGLTITDGSVANGDYLKYGGGLKTDLSNAYADLSNATAASLSSLINALEYQYYLSKLAKGGSKYGEYLEVMFGSKCPAATRDEPEFLGHFAMRLNIDTVIQTTGYDDSSASELGDVGANSQTGKAADSFVNSGFTEPGYLYVLTYFKHQRSYSTAINPVFLKKDLLDYYSTPFANAPDVSMDSERMYFTGDVTARKALGFVEPWLDNKRFANMVYGGMNPQNPNSFDFWTLADEFGSQPTIDGDFLFEDRDNIARALTSGVSGSDYICDISLDVTVSRTMPLRSNGMGVLTV